ITIDAQAVADWTRENGLQLNLSKTKTMILGSSSRLKKLQANGIPPIVIDGFALPYVESTKCLGPSLLTSCTADENCKLQRSLNTAIRFIYNLKKDEHISPYRRELGWLSVKSRRMYYLACYFYKLLSISKPSYLRELF
ncbi:GSCOCG00012804001-RA-CDS, partial [Cotesia congregata]